MTVLERKTVLERALFWNAPRPRTPSLVPEHVPTPEHGGFWNSFAFQNTKTCSRTARPRSHPVEHTPFWSTSRSRTEQPLAHGTGPPRLRTPGPILRQSVSLETGPAHLEMGSPQDATAISGRARLKTDHPISRRPRLETGPRVSQDGPVVSRRPRSHLRTRPS